MSFLSKLFGNKDSLEQLRRAVHQKRWADALVFGETHSPDQFPAAALDEFNALLETAGDALAKMNLEEAEACRRTGDQDRAVEHFDLAGRQARSKSLLERIESSRQGGEPEATPNQSPLANGHDCQSGCASSCTPASGQSSDSTDAPDLDAHIRWDLMLATFPPELAARYAECDETFQLAVLAAHEGDDQTASKLFEQIPTAERNDLFYFERGSLHAHNSQMPAARVDFAKAIELNPSQLLALDALITLEIENGWELEAEQRLQQLLAKGSAPVICLERLALLRYRKGDLTAAADLGEQALAQGSRDHQTILLTAHLQEKSGNLNAAEAILARLEGGGGCGGGGGPVALAEFWLRHNRNLDKALESFKAAFRQEGDNPRWALRIGQVYLAKGWKKEGLPLLRAALDDPKLGRELQQEGEADLARAMGS